MEYMIRSEGMRIALLLPIIVIGLVVLFNDYTIEASELNAEIHLLLAENAADDDDNSGPLIRNTEMHLNSSQIGTHPNVIPLLSLAVYGAPETDTHVNLSTTIDSLEASIRPSRGFDSVQTSPPRQ